MPHKNKIKLQIDIDHAYSFSLANGERWHFVAEKKMDEWIELLAHIVQLTPKTHPFNPKDHRVIFIEDAIAFDEKQSPFRVIEHDYFSQLPQQGWEKQEYRSICFWINAASQDIICILKPDGNRVDNTKKSNAFIPVYNQLLASGGLTIHCGLVEKNGKTALLCAPSGTGKSTCCDRIPKPWAALSDDMALMVLDKNNEFRIHPFPTWSDYAWNKGRRRTWNIEQHYPVGAFFFLERGEDKEEVSPVRRGEAAVKLYSASEQISRIRLRSYVDENDKIELKRKLFDNACNLTHQAPSYTLKATLDGTFWKEMEKVF